MSLLTSAVTSAIDQYIHGQLEKATLSVKKGEPTTSNVADFVFQYNPETITIKRFAATTNQSTQGSESTTRKGKGSTQEGRESEISLKGIIFDTYEQKPTKSVYKEYIEKLEVLVGYDQGKHAPLTLLFNWGKFAGDNKSDLQLQCWMDEFQVEYTMFLNDGTPVRAKVDLTLKTGLTPQELNKEKEMHSPDHAKMVTVRRGDTLSAIAHVEYNDSGEWRRIADANGIDDPMTLRPGMKLLVPPILS
jgi:nucleoid-associated protein YgaU